MRIWKFLLCAALLNSAFCFADEGKRVALIIGNDAYSIRPLQNAVNDARAMDRALRGAGFRTILKENASKETMEKAFVELLESLGPDDTALLFYAGHAVQIENENMLIPVDFQQASSVIDAKYKAFSLARVLDELVRLRHKRTIVILDACRSNPVSEAQSLQAGLAMPLNDSKETYIAFSTSPNHVATDNPNGRDSYFTEALADLIAESKDLSLDDVMTRVRSRVEAATDGKQTPWSQSSLSAKFYFHPPANLTADNDPTLLEKRMLEAKAREQRGDWSEALMLVNQVIAKKPGGSMEAAARARVPFLTARRDAQASYDAGEYRAAAQLFEQAFQLDPFSVDSALQGVNSYLLADDLDKAVSLIHQIRLRGSSADVARSELLLKELSPVEPKAGEELRAGTPPPPPIEQIFSDFRFGVVDHEAAGVFARNFRPDVATRLSSSIQASPSSISTPAVSDNPPAVATALPPGITLDSLHIEVIRAASAKSRDIIIRKVGDDSALNTPSVRRSGVPVKVTTDPPGADISVDGDPDEKCESPCLLTLPTSARTIRVSMEGYDSVVRNIVPKDTGETVAIPLVQQFGFVALDGPAGTTPVVMNGNLLAQQVPSQIKLPAGKYKVLEKRGETTLSSSDIEIKALGVVPIRLPQ
ncbi:MAG TPA: caspase family protein [Bryobacteraceae bacterium]|jgi:tetratricopeptide (TPR) repeat protein